MTENECVEKKHTEEKELLKCGKELFEGKERIRSGKETLMRKNE